jgi:type I restriction enzyme S subunit
MSSELLLRKFEHVTEAPNAMRKLREFVLDLAVRGKLADQDPADQPANELLLQIKSKMAPSSALRSRRNLTGPHLIESKDAPHPIPFNWRWAPIRQVTREHGQTIPTSEFTYIDVTSIDENAGRIRQPTVLSASTAPSRARKIVKSGDVLYSCVRPYLLNIAVVDKTFDPPPIASTAFAVLDGLGLIAPRYLWIVLRSSYFVELVEAKMRGQAYPAINDFDFALLPIPLAPLAEQHRIIAKVDELMALCDELEVVQSEREVRRNRLRSASLRRLGSAEANGITAAEDATFFLDQLPRLITKPEHVAAVKHTILGLAMKGRLARQDQDDEPADILLAKPLALSQEPRRRKVLRKNPPSSLVNAVVPRGWASRSVQTLYDLKAIVDYADGNHGSLYPRKSEFGQEGVLFVTARDLVQGRVLWQSCARLSNSRAKQLLKGWAQSGDVLLTHNATVGRVARVESDAGRFLLGTSVTFYRLNEAALSSDYFYLYLLSPVWQDQMTAIMAQTTRNQVSIQKQAEFTVLIPPRAEQDRIVAVVDPLMAICDELASALDSLYVAKARTTEALLLEALENAWEPTLADVVAG